MRTLPLTLAISLLLTATPALAADFVGPESCKVCHQAAYDAWKDSKHAHATASLTPRQQKDGRCLSCHSPDQGKGVAEVSCETCHGGGQYYSPKYVMKDAELARAVGLVDPSEKGCVKCHDANAPSMKPFNFQEKLKLVDHWTAERQARKDRLGAAKAEEKGKKEEKKEKAP